MLRTFLVVLVSLAAPTLARGEVAALNILHREPYAGGKSFGDIGPSEKLVGVARFAVDPKDRHNLPIIDLSLAPLNAQGKVEFEADVVILTPKDRRKGETLFYDVNNRGNKLALRMFNYGPGSNDLDKPGSEGDGFL